MSTRQNYNTGRIEIDSAETFLKWAKTVQFDVSKWARPRCDYQDDYAHTAVEVIDASFNAATADERRTILCAVYNTMSYDEVERLLLVRAKEVRQIERRALYADFEEVERRRDVAAGRREDAITARERAFKEAMKPYHKRLADTQRQLQDARAQVAHLQERAEWYKSEAKRAVGLAIDDHEDARKFRQVRALLGVA